MENKLCRKCGETKPPTEFHLHPGTRDGRHSTCKACSEARRRQYRKEHPESYRGSYKKNGWKSAIKIKFGITSADYERMLAEQNGVCKICGRTTVRRLAIDHNHTTGKIRGLLCGRCNTGLGMFDDNELLLLKAAAYARDN